jgi:L-2-hydroxyglutarate oxidase LhgO
LTRTCSFKAEAVVVGAGIVGLAIARALARSGLKVLILEKERASGTGTSSRSSEVIHAGLYYEPGSLKATLCVEGKRLLYDYCAERGIAHRRCGKLVVATEASEEAYLDALQARAKANGVEDVSLIGAADAEALEPAVSVKSALLSRSSGIVDSHALMLAYLTDAEEAGANLVLRTPVTEAFVSRRAIHLRTGGAEPAEIETMLLVNAAGLDAWDLSRHLSGLDPSTIPPRHLAKGSYFTLSGARVPFSHLIYPVPEPGGLGVHLTLDLAGQARFGPDVEWVDCADYALDERRGEHFYAAIRRYWPGLPDRALVPAFSGIRPKVAGPGDKAGDFVIQGPAETGVAGYVALYGIESPGLTASLAIGEHVALGFGL